ncbi:hypothetical protein RJ640_006270 [Escallonia rubra]|uniref:RING-type E3 ubiquitin transferase n=1 Tax=Escallonia rubra TaxID=112253 RepID=A0AA88RJR8_9ASTE|nr:hypothetical protein RJ640_006270 [Escallonia rubra]
MAAIIHLQNTRTFQWHKLAILFSSGRAVNPEHGSYISQSGNMLAGRIYCENVEGRASEYSSSSFSVEVQHLPPANSAPSYNPYPQASASGHLYVDPNGNVGHVHPNYHTRQGMHDVQGGALDTYIGNARGAFKRKSWGISGACESGSTSRSYGAGSSSGSSQMLPGKPSSDYQSIPLDTFGLPQCSGTGEESMRNVRSRSILDCEPTTMRTHLPRHPFQHYHSTTRVTHHSGMVDLSHSNADAAAASWEWSSIPLSAAAHDINGPNRETNRFLIGGSGADISGCHHNSFSSTSHTSSQYLHGPRIQVAREERSSHSRRATPSYGSGLICSHLGHEAAFSDSGLSHAESSSSRYARQSFTGGWHSSYRSGRSRIAPERIQSTSRVVDAHDRLGSEAPMMVGRSYYDDSRSLLDQYRDMRLDIDSMSYEELLSLGERIGDVSTGISEDMMSKCVMEKAYCSLNENCNDGVCAICLEEYKDEERVGTLTNCGHDYHVGCIRKWLVMKNVCPICKAAALIENPRQL